MVNMPEIDDKHLKPFLNHLLYCRSWLVHQLKMPLTMWVLHQFLSMRILCQIHSFNAVYAVFMERVPGFHLVLFCRGLGFRTRVGVCTPCETSNVTNLDVYNDHLQRSNEHIKMNPVLKSQIRPLKTNTWKLKINTWKGVSIVGSLVQGRPACMGLHPRFCSFFFRWWLGPYRWRNFLLDLRSTLYPFFRTDPLGRVWYIYLRYLIYHKKIIGCFQK